METEKRRLKKVFQTAAQLEQREMNETWIIHKFTTFQIDDSCIVLMGYPFFFRFVLFIIICIRVMVMVVLLLVAIRIWIVLFRGRTICRKQNTAIEEMWNKLNEIKTFRKMSPNTTNVSFTNSDRYHNF